MEQAAKAQQRTCVITHGTTLTADLAEKQQNLVL